MDNAASNDPDRRAVVVTGAARGLGAVITGQLADAGYTVFAGARDVTQVERRAGVTAVDLDVTDPASITAAAELVAQRGHDSRLHAVVNNAAVLRAGPIEQVSLADVEAQLRANVIGPIAVTQAFLPQLRGSGGRIVNIGSVNADLALPYWGVYSATKAALDAVSDALRMELEPWRIPVTVLTLGAFATDIRARAHASWPEPASGDAYADAHTANGALVAAIDATAGDPADVATALLDVLADPAPPARRLVGDGVADLLAIAAQPAELRSAFLRQLVAPAPTK